MLLEGSNLPTKSLFGNTEGNFFLFLVLFLFIFFFSLLSVPSMKAEGVDLGVVQVICFCSLLGLGAAPLEARHIQEHK